MFLDDFSGSSDGDTWVSDDQQADGSGGGLEAGGLSAEFAEGDGEEDSDGGVGGHHRPDSTGTVGLLRAARPTSHRSRSNGESSSFPPRARACFRWAHCGLRASSDSHDSGTACPRPACRLGCARTPASPSGRWVSTGEPVALALSVGFRIIRLSAGFVDTTTIRHEGNGYAQDHCTAGGGRDGRRPGCCPGDCERTEGACWRLDLRHRRIQ